MDWTAYAATGVLAAGPDHTYIDAGAIKPTFRIDTDSDSYIIQTADPTETYRLYKQRELYEDLATTDVPVPEVVHDGTDEDVPYQVLEFVDGDDPHEAHYEMDMDEILELTAAAGRHLGQAHEALSMDGYGRLGGSEDGLTIEDGGTWRDFYAAFIEGHIDRIEGGPLDQDDRIERAREVTAATTGPATCSRTDQRSPPSWTGTTPSPAIPATMSHDRSSPSVAPLPTAPPKGWSGSGSGRPTRTPARTSTMISMTSTAPAPASTTGQLPRG